MVWLKGPTMGGTAECLGKIGAFRRVTTVPSNLHYGLRPNAHAVTVRPIPRRSLHRPRASTEGSRIKKVNKTGVRLWTACSFVKAVADRSGLLWICQPTTLGRDGVESSGETWATPGPLDSSDCPEQMRKTEAPTTSTVLFE